MAGAGVRSGHSVVFRYFAKWMVIEHKLFQPLIQNMGVYFGRGHVRN
jgi:hypothetical protein